VKKFPIYKYQLYFASSACSVELERNVRTTSIPEAAYGDLFTPVNPSDREFLQICVSYGRFFGTRWYSGELWRYSHRKNLSKHKNREIPPGQEGKHLNGERGSGALNQFITQELQYIVSQNDTMRGPTNYYRTWNIRFNEEKGCERKFQRVNHTDINASVTQMGVSRRPIGRGHRFSSSEEPKMERVRKLLCVKLAGCTLRQK